MNPDTLRTVLMAIFGTLLTAAVTAYFVRRKERREDRQKAETEYEQLKADVAEMRTQNALVQQIVGPISKAYQDGLIKLLTHSTTPELDALLVKVGPPDTRTPDEIALMTVLLKERAEDASRPRKERVAATVLEGAIELAQIDAAEAEARGPVLHLTLETVTAVVTTDAGDRRAILLPTAAEQIATSPIPSPLAHLTQKLEAVAHTLESLPQETGLEAARSLIRAQREIPRRDDPPRTRQTDPR